MICIGHPAHVHFFKNAIRLWVGHGHEVLVAAVDKDLSLYLLEKYGIGYEKLGKNYKTPFRKVIGIIKKDFRLLKIAKKFNPDAIIGIGNIYGSHISRILRKKSIWFSDNENSFLITKLSLPFVDAIVTPSCFLKKFKSKQVVYDGYHELAYLHPSRFKPNPGFLRDLNLSTKDKFSVVRFVAWGAVHDIGGKGFSKEDKIKNIKELENYGKVFITSECSLPKELEKYELRAPPEKIHDLLYYAQLYVGEGGTMASEAAVLGTPSIHISTTGKNCGIFKDLEKYELLYVYDDNKGGIKKSLELLKREDLKKEWQEKRQKMLRDKIDVTSWIVNFVENINS